MNDVITPARRVDWGLRQAVEQVKSSGESYINKMYALLELGLDLGRAQAVLNNAAQDVR